MSIIYEGTTVRFYTSAPFASITGTAIDPDTVTFSWQVQGGATATYTYTNGTGDPTSTIVRDGVGLYHADIDTSGHPGSWVWRWSGSPLSGGADATKTKVATEGNVSVSGRIL
jgi:hypothetical protein